LGDRQFLEGIDIGVEEEGMVTVRDLIEKKGIKNSGSFINKP
jgi:hypothetical protein